MYSNFSVVLPWRSTRTMHQPEKDCYDRIKYLTQAFENSPPMTLERVYAVVKFLLCLHSYYDVWTRGYFAQRGFSNVAFRKIREFREFDYFTIPYVSNNIVCTIYDLCNDMLFADGDIVG